MVVTHATFGLLAVVAYLKSSRMSTADWIKSESGEAVIIVKDDNLLSMLHA